MKKINLFVIFTICLCLFSLTSCKNRVKTYNEYIDASNQALKKTISTIELSDGEEVVSRITTTITEELKENGKYQIVIERKTEELNNYFELEERTTYDNKEFDTKQLNVGFKIDPSKYKSTLFKNSALNKMALTSEQAKEFFKNSDLRVDSDVTVYLEFKDEKINKMHAEFTTRNGYETTYTVEYGY